MGEGVKIFPAACQIWRGKFGQVSRMFQLNCFTVFQKLMTLQPLKKGNFWRGGGNCENLLPPKKKKSREFCINIKILLFWSLFVLFSSNFLQIMFCWLRVVVLRYLCEDSMLYEGALDTFFMFFSRENVKKKLNFWKIWGFTL